MLKIILEIIRPDDRTATPIGTVEVTNDETGDAVLANYDGVVRDAAGGELRFRLEGAERASGVWALGADALAEAVATQLRARVRPISPIPPDTITVARDRVVAALLQLDPEIRQAVLDDWWSRTGAAVGAVEATTPPGLRSLDDANRAHTEVYRDSRRQYMPNGIACPKCGHELVDDRAGGRLASMPPQYWVVCLPERGGCGHRTTRVC